MIECNCVMSVQTATSAKVTHGHAKYIPKRRYPHLCIKKTKALGDVRERVVCEPRRNGMRIPGVVVVQLVDQPLGSPCYILGQPRHRAAREA